MSDRDDGFLSRWARRKARVGRGLAEPAETSASPAETVAVGKASAAAAAVAMPSAVATTVHGTTPSAAPAIVDAPGPVPAIEPVALPTLEDVALLTRSSDYSRFVQPGVDSNVKNAALKKLFSDPHYNVMDGLDTYIDDYSKPDPIPIAMLRQMNQAKFLGLFDDEDESKEPEIATPSVTSTNGAAPVVVAQSRPLQEPDSPERESETRPDDDADLRLQQDDAARRPGAEPCPRP